MCHLFWKIPICRILSIPVSQSFEYPGVVCDHWSGGARPRGWSLHFLQKDDTPVFTVTEVKFKLASLADTHPEAFQLSAAPDRPYTKDQHSTLPQVALDQLRVVHHALHGWDLTNTVMLVTAETAENMANGTHHNLHTCLKVPDKDKWMEAEFDIYDQNDSY
jgi:hypothetical protein